MLRRFVAAHWRMPVPRLSEESLCLRGEGEIFPLSPAVGGSASQGHSFTRPLGSHVAKTSAESFFSERLIHMLMAH